MLSTNHFVVLCSLFCLSWTIPRDIPLCRAGDTTCITRVTTEIIQKYHQGRADIGMPKIEPFLLRNLPVSDGSGGLSLKLSFRDVTVSGLSKTVIDKAVGFMKNPETSKFELSGKIPSLTFKGKYNVGGRILVLPIEGDGDADIVSTDVRISAKFKPIVRRKNGKIEFGVDKLKAIVEPSGVKIKLTNLFNGNKELGENMNKFLNENWRDVWTEIQSGFNDAVTSIIRDILTNVFSVLTYDEIYAPS